MFKVISFLGVLSLALGVPRPLMKPHPFYKALDGRIVGGKDADISDYPHQISLEWYGYHICGGSLIGEKYVVTAAHCTDGSDESELSIRAGTSIVQEGGVVVNVARIHQNPNYNYQLIDFDVSVLELSSAVSLNQNVQPIPLADNEPAANTQVAVSGWGALTEGGNSPSQLQVVEVNIVDRENCRKAYGQEDITDRMICAGVPEGGKDSCQGDSGGPLVANGELAGIVSWGYGCARPGLPGVYSNVAALRDYIREVSGI